MAEEEQSADVQKSQDDDEIILQELCTVNGVNFEKLSQGAGMKVNCLEIFFFGCPRIVGLHHFPFLSCLRIVNQRISSMKGISVCTSLNELWICEGDIEYIEDLNDCKKLTKLYLYSNKIKTMVGLSHLVHLETLWLNWNCIQKIEGISALSSLQDLNLAGNNIEKVEISYLTQLKVLNISGNPITSLKDLTSLYSLFSLYSLSLCDPLYYSCPVCQLCNYSSLVLYHMPWLKWLDGRSVDSNDLQDLIKNIVSKKKQFYRLKIHNQHQIANQERKKLTKKFEHTQQLTYTRLRTLYEHLKALNTDNMSDQKSTKINAVKTRIEELEQLLLKRKNEVQLEKEKVKEKEEEITGEWLVELQSAGNIRYIVGREDSGWYKSCLELVTSRFLLSDFVSQGITSLNIEQIIRIENRFLHNRFTDSLRSILETQTHTFSSKTTYHDFLHYLFLVWTPDANFVTMATDGCGPITKDTPYVTLTNSIGIAEKLRFIKNGCGHSRDSILLLCKVYTGNMIECTGEKKPEDFQDTSHCVYKNLSSTTVKRLAQREFYIFDHHLVLPEYLVSVVYKSEGENEPTEHKDDDSDVLSLPPQPDNTPKLAMLDSTILLDVTNQETLSHIKELDLSCNRLTRFRFSSSLPLLSCLNLSCNELSTTEDFTNMPNLQSLDLSFNRLTTLDGIKSLPKLTVLDVSWNSLSYLHQDIAVLKKHIPSLQSLDIRYNYWKTESPLYIIGMLRSLQYFNGSLVSEYDMTSALRYVVSCHLSLSSLLPHCRTDEKAPPTLFLSPLAQQIVEISKHRPVQLQSSTLDWTSQVTAVDLTGQHIQRLSCLDQLPNLKWLCLQDNALTTADGLESCHKLEELILDNNFLCHPPILKNFSHLRWLSLANNQLTTPPLSSLPHLNYLNISGNKIANINGIECFTGLQELYASDNFVDNQRQLFCLKSLIHLTVIDFTYNPLSSQSTYRFFAIFHLPSLKVIDGQPIDTSEIVLAKEMLGGRLTQDIVFERHPDQPFSLLKTLDYTQCGIKHIDLSPVSHFDNLGSLNLEHNSLTTFSGLIHLNKLKVLCLNHNRIESLMKDDGTELIPVCHSLQVLHLAYNGITSLIPLQLNRLPALRALFLQGNEISRVDGLEGLQQLTELVLDRNKIKFLQEHSFQYLTQLRELHIEENRLCDLSHFHHVKFLERLYLGMNRIQDYCELEKLGCLPHLIELSIISNPVSRRMQHRSLLIFKLPSLQSLDGVMVTAEERHVAEMTFNDRQEEEILPSDPSPLLPALNTPGQVKMTTLPFHGGLGFRRGQTQAMDARTLHLQTLQAFQDRRKGRR